MARLVSGADAAGVGSDTLNRTRSPSLVAAGAAGEGRAGVAVLAAAAGGDEAAGEKSLTPADHSVDAVGDVATDVVGCGSLTRMEIWRSAAASLRYQALRAQTAG